MILHACAMAQLEREEDEDDIQDVRWLMQRIKAMKQRGEWDRGPEHDS